MDHWLLKNVTRKNLSEQEDLWKHRKNQVADMDQPRTSSRAHLSGVLILSCVYSMSLRILFFSIMFSVRILSRFLVKHCPLSIHPAAGQGRGKAVRTFDVLVRRRQLKNATPQFLRTKRLVKKLKNFLGMSQGQNQAGINFDFSRIYRKVPR